MLLGKGIPSLPVGGEQSKRMAHGSRLASELWRKRVELSVFVVEAYGRSAHEHNLSHAATNSNDLMLFHVM